MTSREFWRVHFIKVLLGLVIIQIGVIAFIQNYNHRPVAVRDSASVVENRSIKVDPLKNDTDEDKDDELILESFEQPVHGKVIQKDNRLYYTPESGFFGRDSFKYAVTDGSKISKESYVAIDVKENLPAITIADTAAVYVGNTTFIEVLSNDKDNENDSIFIAEFTQPKYGEIVKTAKGFYYTANSSTEGVDDFTYKVGDGKSNSKETPVVINVLGKKESLYPWLTQDIGNTAIKGSAEKKGSKYIIQASGNDIWGSVDDFRYLYQFVEGDCEMVTKVERLEGSHPWSKSGIMIRENLGNGSKHTFVVLSNSQGATTHRRVEHFGNTVSETNGDRAKYAKYAAPYWLKMKRKGDLFTCRISEDGRSWTTLHEFENPMPKGVFIGVACTNHDNSKLATATYSNILLKLKR